ncbi:GNAT family N-acetyltransferase [Lysinibacillus sp. 54212]|uniref:GNAT family N-acetyltransferase n=1 Tax=Lysinibacillus sp. 54212 TaxID=3119829 RepID=UPI002FCC443A
MLESIVVKRLETIEEIEEARQLEREIWASESVPPHQIISFINHGGLIMGAYLEKELIGFNYSHPAFVEGEVYLYSHMLGIKREFRELGVGELLKLRQKELASDLGYEKCKWTFDPLEARNGYLNFSKLRVYSQKYIPNCYGNLADPFNCLLPSDRLLVEWNLNDEDFLRWDIKINELLEGAGPLVPWNLSIVGLPILDKDNNFNGKITYLNDAYMLPIPSNFQKIKIESPSLAEDWRYKTRAIFQAMFEQGFIVVYLKQENEHISQYLFVKRSLFAL